MTSRNSRTNRPTARSSRVPQSARAIRSARAAQSGRIASRSEVSSFSRNGSASSGAYRSAFKPGSQGRSANNAFGRQSAVGQYSRNNPAYSKKAKKMGRGKKIAIGVFAAVLIAVVGGGSAFALWINSINDQLNRGTKTEEELTALQDVLAPPTSYSEPFYMMLIGSDKRENSDEMGARSDTNIAVRVDPSNGLITLVSIPRDTMTDVDGYGTQKFNAVYNYGGAPATIREANQLLGIEISHYAEVNFEELVALVDAVGGVDVVVDEYIDDPDAGNIVIPEGEQHLDGEAALVFSRSRAYADGDFTRTANQRKLISALVEKVLALPVTELPGVIQKAAQCVTTDMSVSDIVSLAQQFKEKGDLTIYSGMVPSTTGYVGETSYVFTDETALRQMMRVVEEGGDPSTVEASGYIPEGATSGPSSAGSSGYSDSTWYDDGSSASAQGSGYDTSGGYVDDGSGNQGIDSGTLDGTDPGTVSGGGTETAPYSEEAA